MVVLPKNLSLHYIAWLFFYNHQMCIFWQVVVGPWGITTTAVGSRESTSRCCIIYATTSAFNSLMQILHILSCPLVMIIWILWDNNNLNYLERFLILTCHAICDAFRLILCFTVENERFLVTIGLHKLILQHKHEDLSIFPGIATQRAHLLSAEMTGLDKVFK